MHILADALGSVAVIISSLAIDWGGYYIADPICCLLISILILASVVPLIKSTYKVLSLNQNGKLIKLIEKRLPLVPLPANDLVVKISELHVWELAQSQMIVTLKLIVNQTQTEDYEKCLVTSAQLT